MKLEVLKSKFSKKETLEKRKNEVKGEKKGFFFSFNFILLQHVKSGSAS